MKNNLGDITFSENYPAIAGRCLLLKLLDTIILLLEGTSLVSLKCNLPIRRQLVLLYVHGPFQL